MSTTMWRPIWNNQTQARKWQATGFSTIFPLFLWSISASCVFVKRIWRMQWTESYEIHKRFHKLGVALNMYNIIHYYSYMIYIWDAWVAGTVCHGATGGPCLRLCGPSPLQHGTWLLRGCCLKLSNMLPTSNRSYDITNIRMYITLYSTAQYNII